MLSELHATLSQSTQLVAGLAPTFGWTSLLDSVLVAALLYSLFTLIRETRALRILYGIGLLGLLYALALLLHLTALIFLLRSVFALTLVAIPIVFQPELRAALERLGRGELLHGFLSQGRKQTEHIVPPLVLAVRRLAADRTGALIAIERQTGLKDLAQTGIPLDAAVSAELLIAIFHPGAALHDGAIILRGDRIAAAGVFLPLADDVVPSSLGTRHRAALGLSHQTDAVVLVVSEETGKVSIAHHGQLSGIPLSDLARRLRLLISRGTPQ